jgi:hypothetical protein
MAISWSSIEEQFSADAAAHWASAQEFGLDCPFDVFEQLFHDHSGDEPFAGVVQFVDWASVQWEDTELSVLALRRVGVPRPYQHAVDEARQQTLAEGVQDERPEIIEYWRTAGTWLRAPILIAGEALGSSLTNVCLVGFTRLGNLLGLLDRQEVPEGARHRVWLGRSVLKRFPT